jgi:hypothetical protein
MHKPGMTSLEDGSPEPPFWERYVSRTVKNNLVAALSEFVGTTMFLLIAFGGTVCPPTLFGHTGSLANRICSAKTDTNRLAQNVANIPDSVFSPRHSLARTSHNGADGRILDYRQARSMRPKARPLTRTSTRRSCSTSRSPSASRLRSTLGSSSASRAASSTRPYRSLWRSSALSRPAAPACSLPLRSWEPSARRH